MRRTHWPRPDSDSLGPLPHNSAFLVSARAVCGTRYATCVNPETHGAADLVSCRRCRPYAKETG